jgi:hypothetical protein
MVHDGMWPIIAGRRIALNFRWAQPDGALELYQAGSEGPQWWLPHPDPVRGTRGRHSRPLHRDAHLPESDRAFRLGRGVGAEAHARVGGRGREADLLAGDGQALLHRGTTHGGGAGGSTPACPAWAAKTGVSCPGSNFGTGCCPRIRCRTQTVNALRVHFRNWVMKGRRRRRAGGRRSRGDSKQTGGDRLPDVAGLACTAPDSVSSCQCDYG